VGGQQDKEKHHKPNANQEQITWEKTGIRENQLRGNLGTINSKPPYITPDNNGERMAGKKGATTKNCRCQVAKM